VGQKDHPLISQYEPIKCYTSRSCRGSVEELSKRSVAQYRLIDCYCCNHIKLCKGWAKRASLNTSQSIGTFGVYMCDLTKDRLWYSGGKEQGLCNCWTRRTALGTSQSAVSWNSEAEARGPHEAIQWYIDNVKGRYYGCMKRC
jgi:hypothetical protein